MKIIKDNLNNIGRAMLLIDVLVIMTANDWNLATVILMPAAVFLAYSLGMNDGQRIGFRRGARMGIESNIKDFEKRFEELVAQNPVEFITDLVQRGIITIDSLRVKPKRKKVNDEQR